MKRNVLLILVAVIAAAGLAREPILHGGTKASGVPVKDDAGTPSTAARPADSVAPAAQDMKLSRLTGISIRTVDSGKGTAVDVATSRSTAYRVTRMDHPDRLVLDLKGAVNSTDRWRYSSASPLLARVRVGRFSPRDGGIIRIVADLKGNPAYSVERQRTGFLIELTIKGTASQAKVQLPAPAQARPVSPAPVANPVVLRKAEETFETKSIRRPELAPIARAPRLIALRDNLRFPVATEESPSQADPAVASEPQNPPTPRNFPQAVKAAKAAKVVSARSDAGVSPASVPVKQNWEIQNGPKYTGKRISLNLKGVDLKDFFRLIHEVSGLNIIVDPDVSGTVTVVLDDVPWDQALALVLNNNGLGDRLEGNVLRIAKISTLMQEQEEHEKLSLAREESAPLVTVFRQLNYAKAATIAALLKTWVGGGALSRRGSVLVDERSNTLIISDVGAHIPKIESVINRLDRKAQQVSIQARIIRVTSDFARNLSTALAFAQKNGSGSLILGGATGNPVSAEPLTPPTVTTSPATGFGVFVLSNLGRNYAINAAIAAAESHDQAKTISQPSIVTQNNVQGTVIQGTQIPIQTTINNTISVQYVQASLQLKVTPQVTQDGNVFLTIDVENSTPGPALTLAGPTINTQSATTQVLVPSGGTVIFGGVTVHTKSNSSTGVPLLDSIPILGHLFKSTTKQSNDQELLFFVTPKILT